MSSSSPSKKSERSVSNSTKNAQKNNKLFVTNIDVKMSPQQIEAKLRELFEPKGTILKIDVKKSYNNSYCFAFVEFAESEVASNVLAEFKNCEINGKKISIDFQRSNPRERRNYPPRESSKKTEQKFRNYIADKGHDQSRKIRDREHDGQRYPEKRQRVHQKSRKQRRSLSDSHEREEKRRRHQKYGNDHKRRDRQDRRRSPTPEYPTNKREESNKRLPEESSHHRKLFTGCFNCKSMNHIARDCQKAKNTPKESRSPSRTSSESDYRRHDRSRKIPKHPERKRREERRDRQRRFRSYSSGYDSDSSNSYHRNKRNSKKSRKYYRDSSSQDSRRKARYH